MRFVSRALLTVAVLCALGAAAVAVAAPSPFSIALSVTDSGLAATCDGGCAWQEASATFPQGTYRLTDSGIFPVFTAEGLAPRPSGKATFSFVVTRDGRGFSAACEEGCAWVRLSAANESGSFRVTETGVSLSAQ